MDSLVYVLLSIGCRHASSRWPNNFPACKSYVEVLDKSFVELFHSQASYNHGTIQLSNYLRHSILRLKMQLPGPSFIIEVFSTAHTVGTYVP
jgi:hypothetical protein